MGAFISNCRIDVLAVNHHGSESSTNVFGSLAHRLRLKLWTIPREKKACKLLTPQRKHPNVGEGHR